MVDVSEEAPNPFAAYEASKERRRGRRASDDRRTREKVVKPSARSKGKTITVSYRVTPEWRWQLEELAQAEEVSMTEILERALESYSKKQKRKA